MGNMPIVEAPMKGHKKVWLPITAPKIKRLELDMICYNITIE